MKSTYLQKEYETFEQEHSDETEYLQAIYEVLNSVDDIVEDHPEYEQFNIVKRLLEPERIITFKVTWLDDDNNVQVNLGYRVQHSSLLGIYKGGLRFHPSVTQSILKFLAFEQTLKNSLTNLSLGGAKGGSDFNPKGKSDSEIMRFCHAFMRELFSYIGEDIDVPAGDIGVGQKEIGYLYGYYKKITSQVTASMTGKDTLIGGSLVRKEATGYGIAYFVETVLKRLKDTSFKDKKVIVSGSGNVAIYTAKKVNELGGQVVAMSDSDGFIYCKDGLKLDTIVTIKEENNGRIKEYIDVHDDAEYTDDSTKIWTAKADIALPCATQNELDKEGVQALLDQNILMVGEGANMPTTNEGIKLLKKHDVLLAPSKAANAGGVLVSGFEIAQNSQFESWTAEKVDTRLKETMEDIFENIYKTAKEYNKEQDLHFGVNVYSFERLAKAMLKQGAI